TIYDGLLLDDGRHADLPGVFARTEARVRDGRAASCNAPVFYTSQLTTAHCRGRCPHRPVTQHVRREARINRYCPTGGHQGRPYELAYGLEEGVESRPKNRGIHSEENVVYYHIVSTGIGQTFAYAGW